MILLDTCAVVYLASEPERLSAEAREKVCDKNAIIYCSAITAAELACLQERGRIGLPEHWRIWFRNQSARNGWNILPATLELIEEAFSLPSPIHRDPADRVIIATARSKGLTVVTTDKLILDYPHVTTLS
jgi:PIN domain nuclease of toxin-antitoxin system